MNIKHLVLSGGGPSMLQTIGVLHYLCGHNLLNIKELKTIYGTSAGAIVGTLLCMDYEWDTINDYIIKRPWNDLFKIKIDTICESYKKKGLFDKNTIEKCFKPLFDAKNIPLDITFKDFYEYSKIELHMFSFDINEFKLHDISHLTYPKLSILSGLQMSCSLPMLVAPICYENKCFIDGGVVCNYPIKQCFENIADDEKDTILGIKNMYNSEHSMNSNITDDSNIIDFLFSFVFKSIRNLSINADDYPKIKNEIVCEANYMTIQTLKDAFCSQEIRKELFENGTKSAQNFVNIHLCQ